MVKKSSNQGLPGLDLSKTVKSRIIRSGLAIPLLFILCPILRAEIIDLRGIAQVESSGRAVAIGDKHLKNKAYGLYQIRKPLLSDFNHANKTHYTERDMLDPAKASKVASWAFNSYYPRILKAKGHKPSRIALLTCWNMGQGSFFLGKRASDYESKYLKALNNINKK
jgi:hypothetical protein